MPLDCRVYSEDPELVLFVNGYNALTVSDIDNYNVFFDSYLHGNRRFKVFFNLQKVDGIPMDVIKSLVRYMITFESAAQEKVIASSVLVGSTLTENAINLLFKFRAPTTPTKVTSNMQEACDFLDHW